MTEPRCGRASTVHYMIYMLFISSVLPFTSMSAASFTSSTERGLGRERCALWHPSHEIDDRVVDRRRGGLPKCFTPLLPPSRACLSCNSSSVTVLMQVEPHSPLRSFQFQGLQRLLSSDLQSGPRSCATLGILPSLIRRLSVL